MSKMNLTQIFWKNFEKTFDNIYCLWYFKTAVSANGLSPPQKPRKKVKKYLKIL